MAQKSPYEFEPNSESADLLNDSSDNSETFRHVPVLLEPILDILEFPDDATIIDCTLGQAGHSVALAQRLGPQGTIIGIDVDNDSLEVARKNLDAVQCQKRTFRCNFGDIAALSQDENIGPANVILADLGFCSAQIADADRGISFQQDGPLDMRLAGDDDLPYSGMQQTAADIINQTREKELADLIYQYGEERKSRRIAAAIVQARKKKKIETTGELAELIVKTVGFPPRTKNRKRKPIHPATRTFQALRIAVNDELGQLEKLLAAAPELLAPGGMIAIISFHSLEDRIVKYNFRENKTNNIYDILTKKPIIANEAEIASNDRSRSAKLRVARKQQEM